MCVSFFDRTSVQYWRIAFSVFLSSRRHSHSSFDVFYLNKKKQTRQRDICLLLIIRRRRQVEKEMSTKQVSHFLLSFFFDGAHLINMLNRFNSQRMRLEWCRKRMFNGTHWIRLNRERERKKAGIFIRKWHLDLFRILQFHIYIYQLPNEIVRFCLLLCFLLIKK